MAKTAIGADDKVKLAEAAMAMNELSVKNRLLADENKELQEALQRRKTLERKGDGFYITEEEREIGPICPECYLEKGLPYTLEQIYPNRFRCVTCGKHFTATPSATIYRSS